MALEEKKKVLNDASQVLKSEFIGIDGVIDKVINFTRPWYLYNQMTSRPTVVCLWGLTGVGKSSLIERLSDLLGKKNEYIHIDAGEYDSFRLNDELQKIHDNSQDINPIISIDEFQLCRTIDESGGEISKPGSRIIWTLIDSGKVSLIRDRFTYTKRNILDMLYRMKEDNVEIKNGVVSDPKKLGTLISNLRYIFDYGPKMEGRLIDKDLARYLSKEFPISEEEILDRTSQVNSVDEAIDLFSYIFSLVPITSDIDLSHSIIFVLGNLDEAYQINSNLSPDIDPDIFHEYSKAITVNDIKDCLLARFRSEQISRLGNNHIIYPSFSSKDYKDIIRNKINKFVDKVYNELGIRLEIHDNLRQLVYDEGVYPTQGVRPVLSTIYDLVECKFYETISRYSEVYTMDMDYGYGNIRTICDGREFNIPYIPRLEKMRECKMDDLQANVAVHESGHTIVKVILSGAIPTIVRSVTSNSGENGFTGSEGSIKWDRDISNIKSIIADICKLMGGYVAEYLIFGESMISAGSRGDIINYTNLICKSIFELGLFMGTSNILEKMYSSTMIPLIFTGQGEKTKDTSGNYKVQDKNANAWNAVMDVAHKLFLLTKGILNDNMNLLLAMSNELIKNSSINEKEIRNLVSKYAVSGSYLVKTSNGIKVEYIFDKDNICERNKNYMEMLIDKISGLKTL